MKGAGSADEADGGCASPVKPAGTRIISAKLKFRFVRPFAGELDVGWLLRAAHPAVKLKPTGVVLWRASTKIRFLPKDHFMERMLSFNRALGVNCRYCHKQGDFEAETPHKQTARLMMKEFTAKLTKPDGQPISCNDCHQGRTIPLRHLQAND